MYKLNIYEKIHDLVQVTEFSNKLHLHVCTAEIKYHPKTMYGIDSLLLKQYGSVSKYPENCVLTGFGKISYNVQQRSNYSKAIWSKAMAVDALWLGLDALCFYGIL